MIGDATAIRRARRWRETGSFEAKPNKGQSGSPGPKMGSFRQKRQNQSQAFSDQGSLRLTGLPRLTQSHTRAAAIFIDELDAGGFKRVSDR